MDPEPLSMLLGGVLALSLRKLAIKAFEVVTSTTSALKFSRMANQIIYGKGLPSLAPPVTKTIPLMPTSTITNGPSLDSFQPLIPSGMITMIFALTFVMSLSATLISIWFLSRTPTLERATSPNQIQKTTSTDLLPLDRVKRENHAKDILIAKLKAMIIELESQGLHQTSRILELQHRVIDETSTQESLIADNFELQQNILDQASAGLTLITELQVKILDLESKAEQQSSSSRNNLTLSTIPLSTISIEPVEIHPRKLRNMIRGGPNKGQHAQKPHQADETEQTAVEGAEEGNLEKAKEVDAQGETRDLAHIDNEHPKGQGRPGHRARYRQKKRERKAAEEAAARSSTTYQIE
ncbi:MAG: hypothetical protein Q9214_000626 [Letrouitia sp. 1 TL-2023]